MSNCVYGEAMENLKKKVNVILVNNAKDQKKYVSKPSFVSQKRFSKGFVAIHEIKPSLTPDILIYAGLSILDLIKLLAHKFHYKYIGTKYDNCAKLFQFMNNLAQLQTVQFMKLKQMIFIKNLMKIRICLILVILTEDSNFFYPLNKKVFGKMKDEVKATLIR